MTPATTTSEVASRRRALLINVGLSALALALLGWVVHGNREPIAEVLRREVDWSLIGAAFGIYLAALTLTFARWFVLFRAVDVPLGLGDAFRLGFIGNVFNLVVPGAVGGDVVKAGFVYRRVPRERRARGLASMVIDRLVGLLGLFLLATLMGAVAWGRASADVHRLTLVAGLAAACGTAGLCVLFTPALYRPLDRLLRGRPRLERAFDQLVAMASAFRSRRGVVAGAVGMSMINHTMNVLAFYLTGMALFGVVPSLYDHFVIVPLVLFTTAVPLPFGALGLTEGVSGQLFELVAHPGGAVAMMGFRLVMYAGALVSVVVYLANLGQVREAEKAVAEARRERADEAVWGPSSSELQEEAPPVQ